MSRNSDGKKKKEEDIIRNVDEGLLLFCGEVPFYFSLFHFHSHMQQKFCFNLLQ